MPTEHLKGVPVPLTQAEADAVQAQATLAPVLHANLPDATAAIYLGRWVLVTDGRKALEGAAAGTGAMAFSDGVNWVSADLGVAVLA